MNAQGHASMYGKRGVSLWWVGACCITVIASLVALFALRGAAVARTESARLAGQNSVLKAEAALSRDTLRAALGVTEAMALRNLAQGDDATAPRVLAALERFEQLTKEQGNGDPVAP